LIDLLESVIRLHKIQEFLLERTCNSIVREMKFWSLIIALYHYHHYSQINSTQSYIHTHTHIPELT